MKCGRGRIAAVTKEGGRPLVLNDLGGGGGNYRVGRSETAAKHVAGSRWWDAGGGRGGEEGLGKAGGRVLVLRVGGGCVQAAVMVVVMGVGAALAVVVLGGGKNKG